MKKAILSLAAVLACALCLFSSCNKSDDRVLVQYTVNPTSGTSTSSMDIWNCLNDMRAELRKSIVIEDNGLSYESKEYDEAAVKACDEIAKLYKDDVDYWFSVTLYKAYPASDPEKIKRVTLKVYEFSPAEN